MAEETLEQLQGSQETPPAEGSTQGTQETQETSQDQTQVPENQEQPTEQPTHSEDQQTKGAEDQTGQANKGNRAERRIQDLSGKYKDLLSKINERPLSGEQPPQLITQEEIESGAVDLTTLNERIQKMVDYKVNQAGTNVEQQIEFKAEYKAKASEFERDAESVTFENDIVKEMAEQQFNTLNYYEDPISGKPVFIPAVKMSEIKAKIDKGIQAEAQRLVQGNKEYAQSVSNNQAVPTGNVASANTSVEATKDFKQFEDAFSK